ncbi:mechanosensitive ion channel [Rhodobacteraceae bacterium LMO-12]|nr:mechanosensitive ion channel [Rhodobacteraceae bacterium LMO-JJ12]
MTRFIFSFFVAVCLNITPLTAQSPTQPSGTIDVEDSRTKDAAIAVRIRSILAELGGYSDVTVTVSSGIVTLRGTTIDGPTAARLNEIAGRVAGVVAIENKVVETTDVVRRLNPAFERFWVRLKQFTAYLPLLAIAVLAFSLVVLFGFFVARRRQPWDKIAPNAFIADIYRQLIRLAALVAGLVVALDILGATALLSTILGAAGIIGLAIGFAVRDTVENFIASIMLSIRQPFRPNDSIEIGGDEGKVIRLTSRATIMINWDGNHVRIPNSTVFKSRILNYSRNAERRFTFDISVAYGTDLALALQLAHDTVAALPFVLDSPAVNTWIVELAGSDIELSIVGWINQRETSILTARSEAIRQTLLAFEHAGIEMPEPTYRVLTGSIGEAPQEKPAQPASVQAPNVASDPGSVLNVEATEEQELEQIVAEERLATKEDDLLNREGAVSE